MVVNKMASYSVYNQTGDKIADITKDAGNSMITGYDGHWDTKLGPRRWVFDCDLAFTARLHQVRIYIYSGYYMRLED